MILYLWRSLKRLFVLIPGLIVAYFSVRTVFPFVDHKIKLGDALSGLITYIIAAYILVPALIRLWRILIPPKHAPLYCVTSDGFASDPINIGIIGTRRQLILAMEKAGWYIADPLTLRSSLRHVLGTTLGWSYPTAPVSNLFLFGRKQDIAFEIPVDKTLANRHHVRFWATTYEDKQPLNFKSIQWNHRRAHVFDDNLLWVGAATLDVGINFIKHNLQLTHMIDPDTNVERNLIIDQLKSQKLVHKIQNIKLGRPYRLKNRGWAASLHTDGKMSIVTLPKEL